MYGADLLGTLMDETAG